VTIDVAPWLRGIGLEKYAPAFAKNDVDGSLLRELTPEDVAAPGIVSVGHRRRLESALLGLISISARVHWRSAPGADWS
jgi:hypothetical protein